MKLIHLILITMIIINNVHSGGNKHMDENPGLFIKILHPNSFLDDEKLIEDTCNNEPASPLPPNQIFLPGARFLKPALSQSQSQVTAEEITKLVAQINEEIVSVMAADERISGDIQNEIKLIAEVGEKIKIIAGQNESLEDVTKVVNRILKEINFNDNFKNNLKTTQISNITCENINEIFIILLPLENTLTTKIREIKVFTQITKIFIDELTEKLPIVEWHEELRAAILNEIFHMNNLMDSRAITRVNLENAARIVNYTNVRLNEFNDLCREERS
jgi:hypothetical protein